MSTENRGYTTWEEDFLTDRCELHGFNDELIAIVDSYNGVLFHVTDAKGSLILTGMQKAHAMIAAEGLLAEVDL